MTFTAVKLVRVPIFVSIGKAIAKKNGTNENLHADRPPATMIAIPLWAFSPRGKKATLFKTANPLKRTKLLVPMKIFTLDTAILVSLV